jgi:isopentenyl-diphosphate delta-isomerase
MDSGEHKDLADEIKSRKAEHLRIARGDVESKRPAGWADVEFVHLAVPELDYNRVDLSTTFLGRRLKAPLVIAAMTGGHGEAHEINARLGRAAERYGLAMGVGSQRAALQSPSVADTYAVARREAPSAFLIANIGAAQLIRQDDQRPPFGVPDIERAIEMIRADALAVHLNVLEEVVQPEGDRRAQGYLSALEELISGLGGRTPVIAKETGAGISAQAAERLAAAGVKAFDVGGRGGTSFAAVEARRAAARRDEARARLGEVFRDWGLPTPVAVVAAGASGLPVIATGGIRSGLDAAKALALGATLVGVARPMLQAATKGEEAVYLEIEQLLSELAMAMFLTGSANVSELQNAPRIVLGDTHAWLTQLGFSLNSAGP